MRNPQRMGCAALLTLSILFVGIFPAIASEGVACATVQVTDDRKVTVIENPDDMGISVVGHFLWLQHTDTPDSLHNIVSHDLDSYEDGAQLTVCTDGIQQDETISTGQGSASSTVTDTGKIVVYSTDEPHPQVVEEWVRVENGYLIK